MIKLIKYGNRKIYRPNHGYINLPDLLTLQKSGVLFRVVCAKTRLDITEETIRRAKFYANERV